MSKSGERRLRSDALYLTQLAQMDLEKFHREFNKRLRSWLEEIRRRGNALRDDIYSDQPDAGSDEARVFGILEKVNRLLALCAPEVEREVGAKTRNLLKHACAKAVALTVSPDMYKVVYQYKYHQKYGAGRARR